MMIVMAVKQTRATILTPVFFCFVVLGLLLEGKKKKRRYFSTTIDDDDDDHGVHVFEMGKKEKMNTVKH